MKRRRGQPVAATGSAVGEPSASSAAKLVLAPPKLEIKEGATRKLLRSAAGDAKQRLRSELFAAARRTTLPEDGGRVIEAWPEWIPPVEGLAAELRASGNPNKPTAFLRNVGERCQKTKRF